MSLQNTSTQLPSLNQVVDSFEKDGNEVIIFPTLHDQIGFSAKSKELLDTYQPDRVLVELPQEMEEELITAIDRLPLVSAVHTDKLQHKGDRTIIPSGDRAYIVHPGEAMYWTSYLARRAGIPVTFMDHWSEKAYQSWQIPLAFEHLASVGWNQFWEEGRALAEVHLQSQIHGNRSKLMVEELKKYLDGSDTRLFVICGAAHWPAFVTTLGELGWDTQTSMVPERVRSTYLQYLQDAEVGTSRTALPTWNLSDIHPHTIHLVTGSFPYYLSRLVEQPTDFDQLEAIRQLYFEAEKRYQQKFDERISPSTYRRMFQFLRNLNRIQGKVVPDLYNLVAAAKGTGDGDYAFEVYRTAIGYPFLPAEDQKLDNQLKFTPDEEQSEVIKFAFKRRMKRPVLKKVGEDEFEDLDPIPDEEYPGQWQEIWDKYSPYGYVSYPPEDEFIEQYMQYLRKRIIEILMEEESSTLEFDTSLEDGIDWRETMRHYHEGKIFVKKYPKNKHRVGALVVQFLEEPYDTKEYSHHSTLFAEHDQESHISVITTEPGDVIIGPGISRVKYAAIISQFPPVGMPYLIGKENVDLKLRLIWTAMHMSLNKIIGFVAKKPPTAAQRHFAAKQGYRLVYLPMGQLTGQSLRRLRTMHLLAHRDLRDNAREYIGF